MKLFRLLKPWLNQGWKIPPTSRSSSSHSACCRTKLQKRSPEIVILSVISLTLVLGHRFSHDPKLSVGTPAPQTIRAPKSAIVEDTVATHKQREAARQNAIPIFMINQAANQQITQNLEQRFTQSEELRKIAGSFPFTQSSILSTTTQRYLRQVSQVEWRTILDLVQKQQRKNSSLSTPLVSSSAKQAIAELKAYHTKHPGTDWAQLLESISKARQRYQAALIQVSAVPPFDWASLLNLTNQDWEDTQQGMRLAVKRMLSQGIPPGLPEDLIDNAVTTNVASLPSTGRSVAAQLLLEVLQPNLMIDRNTTLRQAEQAAQQVQPVMLQITQGAVIVRAGQSITQKSFVLLDHFGLSRRGVNWLGLISTSILVSGAIAVFWGVQTRFHVYLSKRDYFLILLLSLSAPIMALTTNLSYTSLPAVGLLVGSFYGSALGGAVVALLTALMPLGIESNLWELLPIAIGSLVGGVMAGRLRSREELALLGGIVALIQGTVYLLVMSATGLVWYSLLGAAAWRSFIGLSWSIVALGISPYLEHLFDLVTPIRLAELANPNRPLLKRLAQEAPGTFQHTLFVATLAEAGAQALGCNVELVRTGTLYHDIGKMHDPLGFIENQMGGPNKHDTINDPWKSVEIIKRHVTEGMIMARKCRLPKAIQAFIPEHQGTMLVSYFYYQAQQQATEASESRVREVDFRYAGPIPQSRETGLVMLADSCEAALRSLRVSAGESLKEATPEDALNMVKKIFKARWQDNQLVDSQLTREELSTLAEIFVQVWLQFNHQRIRYPSGTLPATPKAL
jgi:hypothetical protein